MFKLKWHRNGGVVKTFRCTDENQLMFGPLAKRYEGIEVHDPPQDGDVQFVFHTYHGFVVVMMQTEHRISCSPDDARELLSRFHRFNLCWGLLGPGLVYVPFLTFGNYYA